MSLAFGESGLEVRVEFLAGGLGRLGAGDDRGEDLVDALVALERGPLGGGRGRLRRQRAGEESLLLLTEPGGLGGRDALGAVRDPAVMAEDELVLEGRAGGDLHPLQGQ